MLLQAFHYERKKNFLQFFLEVVAENGNTFQQNPLFARSIDTTDPENVEAIVSTQFESLYQPHE